MLNDRYCVGMYLDNDDTVCSSCMSETDYAQAEVIITTFDVMDYRSYCVKCGEPIDHSLTRDGWEFEASLSEEQVY